MRGPAGWHKQSDGRERFWNGHYWTNDFRSPAPAPGVAPDTKPLTLMSSGQREQRLEQAMAVYGLQGEITRNGPYQFQFKTAATTVPHVLYALLSLVTCGAWLLIWLLHVAIQKEPTLGVVRVDEYGAVWVNDDLWWPPAADHVHRDFPRYGGQP